MRRLAILVIILLALLLAACGGSSAAPPAVPTSVPAAVAPPTVVPTKVPPTVVPTRAIPTAAPPTVSPTKASPTATPTEVPVAKVGEPAEANGIRLIVHSVERKGDLGQFFKADPGRAFLVVDVTIEDIGQPEHDYNPLWFKARDGTGQEYNATIGGQDALGSGKMGKGERVKGVVVFNVKEGAKDLTLIYDTVPLGASRAQQVRVQLGTP